MSVSVTPMTIVLLVLAVLMIVGPQIVQRMISPQIQSLYSQHKNKELLDYLDKPIVRIAYPKWNVTFMKLNAYLSDGDDTNASRMLDELLAAHSSNEQRKELIIKAFDFYIGCGRYDDARALIPEINQIVDEPRARRCQETYEAHTAPKAK